LATLQETDSFGTAFQTGYQTCNEDASLCYRRTFELSCADTVFDLAQRLAGEVQGKAWLLLTHYAHDCGAVSVELSTLLSRAKEVIAFDRDSLCALSPDQQQGLLIDYSPDDIDEAFTFAIWGDSWASSFIAATSQTIQQHKAEQQGSL